MTLGAVVLCGGESRRMGRAKAWLPFGDEVMLQRVVRVVGSVVGMGPVVVVAAAAQELPPLPAGVELVRDEINGRGPLQGFAAGLAALPAGTELVYASATDAPFLRASWVERLATLVGDHDLAIPRVGGFLHPLAALYRRRAVLPAAVALLEGGCLRPTALVDVVKTRIVSVDELIVADPDLATLRNLNTPEDYRGALSELFPGGMPD